MSFLSRLSGSLSFAHLAGVSGARGRRAEGEDHDDEERKGGRRAEDDDLDDDDRKSSRRAEEGQDDDEDDRKRSRRAEGDDRDDDDDRDSDKGKRGKRAKRGEEPDADEDDDRDSDPDAEDDEDEMRGKSAIARARRRERARCAAIFGSKNAARNPVLAANLAFNSSMTRREALAVLRDTPAGVPAGNAGRAARNPQLGASDGAPPSRKAVQDSAWDRAFAKARR